MKTSKLKLKKTTVRHLSGRELAAVAGGITMECAATPSGPAAPEAAKPTFETCSG